MWYSNLTCNTLVGAPINKKLAKIKNARVFQNTFASLVNIANHRYKIKDGTCPETINERVFLQGLLWYGTVTVFEYNGVLMALPSRMTNSFNCYGEPSASYIFGRNGLNLLVEHVLPQTGGLLDKTVDGLKIKEGKGVFIRENEIMYPFINYVYQYAENISDTLRTIDTQRFHCKRPYIITAQEQVVPTVKEYFNKTKDNEEYIVGSGIFDANAVNAIPITVTAQDIKGMTELYDWYMAKFLEMCGIKNNQASSKKENLIVDEVNANNEITEFGVEAVVNYLNEQLELVNEVFGTNMEVEVNHDAEQDIQTDDDGETAGAVSGDTGEQ